MKLTLSLKEPSRLDGASPTYVLQEGSTVIGRAPEAGWRLPDPDRIVSKAHCRIDAETQGFIVTDISTNGAFVNGEPVGYERKRLLADGDRLRLGDIDISVSIDEAKDRAGSSAIADGPFGNEEVADRNVSDDSPPDTIAQSRGMGEPIKEDWWTSSGRNLRVAAMNDVSSEDQGHASGLDAEVGSPLAISPTDAIVMSLVQSFPSLDAATLASAVDAAGARIPEAEWQDFYERLRSFLRERYPDSR